MIRLVHPKNKALIFRKFLMIYESNLFRQTTLAKAVEEDNRVILYPPQVWGPSFIVLCALHEQISVSWCYLSLETQMKMRGALVSEIGEQLGPILTSYLLLVCWRWSLFGFNGNLTSCIKKMIATPSFTLPLTLKTTAAIFPNLYPSKYTII